MVWEIIDEALKKRNLSSYQLSLESGLSESTIQNIRSGVIKSPGIRTIFIICDTLDIDIEEFKERYLKSIEKGDKTFDNKTRNKK